MKMMKKLFSPIKSIVRPAIILSAIFLFAGYATSGFSDPLSAKEREWLKRHETELTVALETNYAPFAFVDRNQKSSGLATDYLKLIQKKLGFSIQEIKFESFNHIIESAIKNKVDIVNAVTETANRSQYLLFTKPFIEVPNVIIVRKEKVESLTIDRLKELKISTVKNYAITEYLSKKHPYLNIDLVPDDLTALLSVSFNRTDCAILDLATASYLIDQKGITNLRVSGDVGYNIKLSIASRKDWPILNQILNKGLAAISVHEHESIRNKWISINQTRLLKNKFFWGIIASITLVFLFCFLAVLIWNRTLKKQISKRTNQLTSELEERKKTEKALQKSEAKYRTILKSAMDGFWVTDTKGRLLEVNEAYCRMSGYNETELVSMCISDLEVHETSKLVVEHLRKVASSGSDRFESKHRRKDETIFDVEVSVQFRSENDGRYICFLHDITEQKRAFKEIRNINKKMKLASDSAQFGIWDLDVKENRLIWDDWMFRLYGINRDHFTGAYEAWQKGVHPDDLERASKEVQDALTGERQFDTEFRIIRPNGEIRHLKAHATVSRDELANPVQMTGINYDITEKKDLEARIQQSQKIEAIGNLAGGIAHDFNNILFPVIGMSELLIEDLPLGSVEQKNAEEIFKAGKRGSALVKQILAFSRQSGNQMAPTRVQNILKEVLKLSRSTIPSDIEINQDIQTDCGLIMADPTQIHQVAMNLVTNAFHAVEANGGNIHVSLKEKLLQTPDLLDSNLEPVIHAVLSVSDTGRGIPPQIIDKIFDPYFTTKEQGKGTGLGLAVVHGIIKEHKGDIKVYTEIGKGTTFNVYIPLMETSDTDITIEGDKGHPVGNERVLLVDDEESIAKLEKQMLERLGYKVTIRISSPDALQILKSTPDSFDLVITDMTMPNMTGDKLAKEIMAIRPDIPIIICTGFSERLNKEKAEAFGIKGFLMKPVVKSDLAQKVREVLDAPG